MIVEHVISWVILQQVQVKNLLIIVQQVKPNVNGLLTQLIKMMTLMEYVFLVQKKLVNKDVINVMMNLTVDSMVERMGMKVQI